MVISAIATIFMLVMVIHLIIIAIKKRFPEAEENEMHLPIPYLTDSVSNHKDQDRLSLEDFTIWGEMLATVYQPTGVNAPIRQAYLLSKLNQIVVDFNRRGIVKEGFVHLRPGKCLEILLQGLND